jgi:hypothetical protein
MGAAALPPATIAFAGNFPSLTGTQPILEAGAPGAGICVGAVVGASAGAGLGAGACIVVIGGIDGSGPQLEDEKQRETQSTNGC